MDVERCVRYVHIFISIGDVFLEMLPNSREFRAIDTNHTKLIDFPPSPQIEESKSHNLKFSELGISIGESNIEQTLTPIWTNFSKKR